jgi:hypothetical protein
MESAVVIGGRRGRVGKADDHDQPRRLGDGVGIGVSYRAR